MKEADIKSITDRESTKKKDIEPDININVVEIKNWTIIIITIIVFIIALIAIGLFIFKFLLNKKKKNDNHVNDDNAIEEADKLKHLEYRNITSSYIVFKNQVFIAFNPDKIGLKSFEYSIRLENKVNLRLLSIGESMGIQIRSNINGKIKLTIIIKRQIYNLNGLFSNVTNLQSVDLSGLNLKLINNFDSLFDGCSSLEDVKFPMNTISSNVLTMNDMFKGCIKLNFVNLTSFNITEKTSMNGVFSGCSNLQNVDISSFNFITAGFFKGINSGVNIIFNTYLSDQIKNVTNTLGLKINLFLKELFGKK